MLSSLTDNLFNFLLPPLRCGSTANVFFMEVGRLSATGDGELWMDTYDPMIANNMTEIILQWVPWKKIFLISAIHY